MWDADQNEYIDYWNGAGPTVLGHSHPAINQTVKDMMDQHGVQYCAPHEWEVNLAKRISEVVPSAEMSAFGCGGSDALCYAVRAARSYTGRRKILKFEGSYNGWYDGLLFNVLPDIEHAGADDAPVSVPHSSGLLPELAEHTIVLPYNSTDMVADLLARDGEQFACIVVEPVLHSQGCILPKPGFLSTLRKLCDQYRIVLVFDEILTGFRHGIGGCQVLMDVHPDLTAFGKAMSNGFPICSLSGRREIMACLAPEGTAFFSGTYNGNILCVAAALKTLELLSDGSVHQMLWGLGKRFADGSNAIFQRLGLKVRAVHYGSICSLQFTEAPVHNYRDLIRNHDKTLNRAFTDWMLERGIYTMPRRANRFYISAAHNEDDIDRTLDIAEAFFTRFGDEFR
jgi:glutamate-1-semialdehyde 2,1-aminomutase